MVNRIMKVMENNIGILKVIVFFYMVVIQLNILILVGMAISMVMYMQNRLFVNGSLIVNMWCVQIIKDKNVMEVVVYIMEVQLNNGLWVKVGMIVEMILKVGRIMMYIFGCLKNQNMCWNNIGLLLFVVLKKLVLKCWLVSIMVIVLVKIGIIVISRNVVINQVYMNNGIFIKVMLGVCRLKIVMIMLIVFMMEEIFIICIEKMKKFVEVGLYLVDRGVQNVQLKLGVLVMFRKDWIIVIISKLKVKGRIQKFQLLSCGNVMFGVLIISGII